jgi:tetratricopeptide (TPR) repeat protein
MSGKCPRKFRRGPILKDNKSGEDVGYIQPQVEFNIDTLMKGINELKKGILLFPNRLDMRFGLVTVTEKSGLYKEMTEALREILKQSVKINNDWLWSFGEKNKEYSKEFMLHNVQGRAEMLFGLQTLQADSLIIEISKTMVEKYPDCIYGYNNLGTCYLVAKEYKKAIENLERAFKLDSKDTIVISNLAEAYKRLKDKKKAKEFYLLLSKYGNNEEKEKAQQNLDDIDK